MSIPSLPRRPLLRDTTLLKILLLSAVLFVLVLVEPLGPDNAVLHSIARDWVQYGRIPYIGSWDNNFPGIMMMHALEIKLFGISGVAFRLFDIGIQLAFVGFLYRFLLRWLPEHTAALAAILYALYYVAGNTYLFGQQDGYGMMCVLFAIALLQGKDLTIGTSIISAIVCGLSVLMRPTFLLYPGLLSLYLLFSEDLRIQPKRIGFALVYFVVSLIPMGTVLGYYATIPGGLQAFYTSTIRFNLDLYTQLSGGSFWVEVARTGLLLPLAIFALVLLLRHRISVIITRRDALLYLSLVAGGLFVVVLMGKFWRYHFAPFFMALLPLTAIGIEYSVQRFQGRTRRNLAATVLLVLCSLIMYNPKAPLAFGLGLLQNRNPFAAADEARRSDPRTGAKAEHAVLQYLDLPKNKDATVEVCGFDPYLRLDLDRPCVGPYVTFHSIGFRKPTSKEAPFTPYQRAWQSDYLNTLNQTSPTFLILGRDQRFWYITDIYRDCLKRLSGFDSLFLGRYSRDTTFGAFELYRLR